MDYERDVRNQNGKARSAKGNHQNIPEWGFTPITMDEKYKVLEIHGKKQKKLRALKGLNYIVKKYILPSVKSIVTRVTG